MKPLAYLLLVFLFSQCYSFKGLTIAPEIETYYIEQFALEAKNAPADVADIFSDALRDKINNNTRLSYSEENPHIEFRGAVSRYYVDYVAPQQNGDEVSAALNRLVIDVQVEYFNNEDEEDTWTQRFSFFQDFERDEDLNSVQYDLIDVIYQQLLEDIFNKAFTNW